MKTLLFIVVIFIILGSIAYIEVIHSQPPVQILAAMDHSSSVAGNCSGLEQETRSAIAQQGIRNGSMFTILLMGSSTQDAEPRVIFSHPIPVPSSNIYGRNPVAFEKRHSEFLAKVRSACESTGRAQDSPIFRMFQRAVDQLRRTCSPTAMCYLFAKTDLEETSDPLLTQVLARAAKDPSVSLPPTLARSIDNSGISVEICGVAEKTARRGGVRSSASPEALGRLWKAIFTHPELVSMHPFCGGHSGKERTIPS